jgi:hypothetical protein
MKNVTIDDIYEYLPKEIKNYIEFLQDNEDTIKGLYTDRYYKNGGWNGIMDAISHVQKQNNIITPDFDIKIPEYPDIDMLDIIVTSIFYV